MTKKQYIPIIAILIINSLLHWYFGVFEPWDANRFCTNFAEDLTRQKYHESFIDFKGWYPEGGINSETLQEVKAHYDFVYDFCMHRRGWGNN